jgi:F420H(2)-dependent quinone reductase
MPEGRDFAASPLEFNKRVIERYEQSRGEERFTQSGQAIVIVHSRGAKTRLRRKTPLVRVEYGGSYGLVASFQGAANNPQWYHNLKAWPDDVELQDGPEPSPATIRELSGDERERWWQRAVGEFPPYSEYQRNTHRLIPVFVATPQPRG